MRLEELQMTANRAWRIHLMRCTLIALILVIVSIEQYRRLGFLYSVSSFNIIWGIGSFLLAAYIAELTRHEWLQLQAIRKLRCLPTTSELRIAKAKDKLHHSILNAALLCCAFGLIVCVQRGTGLLLLWMLPGVALGIVLKTWQDLRRVTF